MAKDALKDWNPKPLPELEYKQPSEYRRYEAFREVMCRYYVTDFAREYKKIDARTYGHGADRMWRTKPYAALGIRFNPNPGTYQDEIFGCLPKNDSKRFWRETAVTLGNDAIHWYLCGAAEPFGAPGRSFYDSVQLMVIKGYYPADHKIPKSWFYHGADHVLRRVAHLTGANVTIKEVNGMYTIGTEENIR